MDSGGTRTFSSDENELLSHGSFHDDEPVAIKEKLDQNSFSLNNPEKKNVPSRGYLSNKVDTSTSPFRKESVPELLRHTKDDANTTRAHQSWEEDFMDWESWENDVREVLKDAKEEPFYVGTPRQQTPSMQSSRGQPSGYRSDFEETAGSSCAAGDCRSGQITSFDDANSPPSPSQYTPLVVEGSEQDVERSSSFPESDQISQSKGSSSGLTDFDTNPTTVKPESENEEEQGRAEQADTSASLATSKIKVTKRDDGTFGCSHQNCVGKTWDREKSVEKHQRTHFKNVQCDICLEWFQQDQIGRHRLTTKGHPSDHNVKLPCPFCGKEKRSDNLLRHIKNRACPQNPESPKHKRRMATSWKQQARKLIPKLKKASRSNVKK